MNTKSSKSLFWAIFLFVVFTNLTWLITDQKLPIWDPALDFISTVRCFELFKNPSIKIFREIAGISAQDAYRPPFVKLLICPFYLFFPKNIFFTTLTMSTIFWYVLFFAVFNLGKLIKNEKVGLYACFIVGTYPFMLTLSRIYLLDFPLTAMVTLSLYLLLLGFQINTIRYFIILGLVLGFGLLTKAGFLIFLIGPLIYLLSKIFTPLEKVHSVREKFLPGQAEKKSIKNRESSLAGLTSSQKNIVANKSFRDKRVGIIISLLIAGIIALLYYGFVFKDFLGFIQWATRHSLLNEGDPSWNTIEGWAYYLKAIVFSTSPFYFLFFIAGFFSIFKMKKEHSLALLLWIFLPYLFLTYAGMKDGRYIVPVLPAVALISAFGIDTLFKHRFKKIIIVSMIIIGTTQFLSISFGIIRLPKIGINTKIKINPKKRYLYIPLFIQKEKFSYGFNYHPKDEDWKIKELFNIIENDRGAQKFETSPYVLLLVNHHIYNVNTMKYCSFILGKDFEFDETSHFNAALIKDNKYSYIIYKDSKNSSCSYSGWDKKNISEAYSFIKENPANFKSIFQNKLPDGSTLYCYKRIP